MNENSNGGGAQAPTAEVLAGRLLRLLRQGRGWSQSQVADRMRAFGYSWNQSTVTRIESASRPLRVNELSDLALLFGISATQLLEPQLLLGDDDDLRAVEAEIAKLGEQQHDLEMERDAAAETSAAAQHRLAEIQGELARVKAGLEILTRWHPAGARGGGLP